MSLVQVVSSNLTTPGLTQTTAAINVASGDTLLFFAVCNSSHAGTVTPVGTALWNFGSSNITFANSAVSFNGTYAIPWTPVTGSPFTGNATGLSLYAWYAPNASGGSTTFSLNTSGADTPTIIIVEDSGRDTFNPLDIAVTASDASTASGAHTTGSITPRNGRDDVFAFNVASTISQTFTSTGNWNTPPNGAVTSSTGYDAFVQYQNGVTVATIANTYSVTLPDKLDAFIVAMQPPMAPYADEYWDWFNEVPEDSFTDDVSQPYIDIEPQISDTDQDWLDECGENDAWTLIEDQSAIVGASITPSTFVQYFGEDAELYDEALETVSVPSTYLTSNTSPQVVLEEPWDWFQEIDDDEWIYRDESNVQIPNVVDVSSQVFADLSDWDEDPDDFYAEEFGNDDADLPQNDVWDHWPTDDDDWWDDDFFGNITYAGVQPLNVEDGWTEHWPTDDDEWEIPDDYYNAPNPLLNIEDAWDHGFGTDDDDYPIIDDYVLRDNVASFDDAWDWWPTDDDDYPIIDDYALVSAVLPAALLNLEDPWDWAPNDPDDETYQSLDTDPVGASVVIAIAQPPEDAWDWFVTDDDDYATPDDYASVNVSPPMQTPVDDAWDWSNTDDDDYVVTDDYASVNNTPIVVEDAWDHWVTDPDDETFFVLDSDKVSVPQPAAIEDPWDWSQDADDDEWAFRDMDAVAPFIALNSQTDGWDYFQVEEDDYYVADDYQFVNYVVPASQFTDESWDWFYEPAEDNDMDFAVANLALANSVYVLDPNYEVYMPFDTWTVIWLPKDMGGG